jgi:L-ectoine synthase
VKVVSLHDVVRFGKVAKCPKGGFESFRLLLASDGLGFSMSLTHVPKGPPQFWHYTNHLEACYCISGRGNLVELESEQSWLIEPGHMYSPDNHDPHTFEALEDVSLVCVFNPPLFGIETHDEEGSYPLGGSLDGC